MHQEEHDYPAAFDYLEIDNGAARGKTKRNTLQKAKVVFKRVKIFLEQGNYSFLPPENIHVKREKRKKKGKNYLPFY